MTAAHCGPAQSGKPMLGWFGLKKVNDHNTDRLDFHRAEAVPALREGCEDEESRPRARYVSGL